LTKTFSKRAAKNFISALKMFMQFFSRMLAFFRNNYFIYAYSVFRWCFTTEICFWETREWFKIFKYTLNRNGAELFGFLHLGTILHLRKCTLLVFFSGKFFSYWFLTSFACFNILDLHLMSFGFPENSLMKVFCLDTLITV
jgi:hypothetical protein